MTDKELYEVLKRADNANDIINDLHKERLDYYSEYVPLIESNQDILSLADEIERLQAENRRLKKSVDNQCDDCACEIADERDKLKEEVERLKAERDKAVENLENLIGCHCACSYCANLMPDGTCEVGRKYGVCTCLPKWRGLEDDNVIPIN